MTIKWQPIERVMRELYADLGIDDKYVSDIDYLKKSFDFTEELWWSQLDRMTDIKVVMLSEAPLFGPKQTYIYNPKTSPSAFFHFNDLSALLDKKILSFQFDSVVAKKSFLIDCLAENGLLVLDLFPYALNPKITQINFRTIPKTLYRQLLFETESVYLRPKIEAILSKSKPVFVYRYKKLADKTNRFMEDELKQMKLIENDGKLTCVGGTNMSIDRDKLGKYFRQRSFIK